MDRPLICRASSKVKKSEKNQTESEPEEEKWTDEDQKILERQMTWGFIAWILLCSFLVYVRIRWVDFVNF